jgi:nucleotidyltransferase substrate binding protein (TIGR01987 family)
MSDDRLILTPFENALKSLEEVLQRPKDDIVRDATIQRFEYTYELAWKIMKRHLKWSGTINTDPPTKRDLFREAENVGLIRDAETWFEYDRARNKTSHTYDETTAEEVYEAACKFGPDARTLLVELKKYHG